MKSIEQLISREEVLAGKKSVKCLNKVGDEMTLNLTAIKRSELMALMRQHPEDFPERLLVRCSGETEWILDELDFDSLIEAQRIANALCQGLPSAKKLQIAEQPDPTPESPQRESVDLEVELVDGTRDKVRVHAIEERELLAFVGLPPGTAMAAVLARVLQVDLDYANRISAASQFKIVTTLAALLHGDEEAAELTSAAAALTRSSANRG